MDPLSGTLVVGCGIMAANSLSSASKTLGKNKVKRNAKKLIEGGQYNKKSNYNFNRYYISNERQIVKWLQNIQCVYTPLYVPCMGIRYVDTSPEMSMELIDYNGDKRIVSMSRVIDAMAAGKINIINAQTTKQGLMLFDA